MIFSFKSLFYFWLNMEALICKVFCQPRFYIFENRNEKKIYCCLWIASVLYRKYDNFGKDHSNFDIDYLEQRDMFDQYSKHIRPEMLKLLTFLKGHITTTNKQTGFQTPLPIRIEAGAERIEIDNTAGWFVGALEEYLHTF